MPRPEPAVRVSDDPALLAAVRAAARAAAAGSDQLAAEQVRAGGYVDYRAWNALKEKPGEAWTAVRAVLDDPATAPAGKANAAARLREFGDPAGEAYLIAALSDPAPEVRAAALGKLWQGDGDTIDMTPPDRRGRLLDLIGDPDPAVARNAMLAATWRPGLPGAADRIAARLAAGTAPDLAEWGLDLLGIAETADHVRVALPHAFPPRAEFGHASYAWTLRRTLVHPDPEVREPVRKALLADCLRFPAERGEQHLARTLAAVADESALPVLEEMAAAAADPFVRASALGAIARLRPATAVDRILDTATRSERWAYHPEMLATYATEADAHRVLAALGPAALKQSEYNLEHFIRLCLSTFGEAGRRAVAGWLPHLTPRTRAVAVWGLEGLDLRAALDALGGAGLLPLPVDEVYEAGRRFEQQETGAFDPAHPDSVHYALSAAGLVVSFDAESDERPSPHDQLVMRFGRHSRGGFSPECAVQIPGEEAADEGDWDDEDGDPEGDAEAEEFDPDGPLRVRFVHAGKVYEFDPENFGDWYDVAAVAAAANRAVADGGRPERFLAIETGGQAAEFVFADPARFVPVARRLGLPVRRDELVE